jgi:glycosyltransferase involved in cell wall biosynthesis
MSNQPLVSIIIPTFNRAHLIGETLDSVVAQTYENWECIVVDDGSRDNTDEVVGEYVIKDSRFKYHHRPEDHLPGGNGARNYGFKMSQGEYVNWFDSDDLMDSRKIEKQISIFLNNSKVDVVFCECQTFSIDHKKTKYINRFSINAKNLLHDYVLRKINIAGTSALWDKKVLYVVNYDEKLLQSQDYEFISRLFARSPNYEIISESLLLIRKKNDSISSKFMQGDYILIKSYLRAYTKLIQVYSNNEKIQIGLINLVLKSLNNNLYNQERKKLLKYTIDKMDFIFSRNQSLEKFKNKWLFLKLISKLIIYFKFGAYKTKELYKIN